MARGRRLGTGSTCGYARGDILSLGQPSIDERPSASASATVPVTRISIAEDSFPRSEPLPVDARDRARLRVEDGPYHPMEMIADEVAVGRPEALRPARAVDYQLVD